MNEMNHESYEDQEHAECCIESATEDVNKPYCEDKAYECEETLELMEQVAIEASVGIQPSSQMFGITLDATGGRIFQQSRMTMTMHNQTLLSSLPRAELPAINFNTTARSGDPSVLINLPSVPALGWSFSQNGNILPGNTLITNATTLYAIWPTYEEMNARELAREIIARYRRLSRSSRYINLTNIFTNARHSNGRSALMNLVYTVNGQDAITPDFQRDSPWNPLPNVPLQADLLRAILYVSDRYNNIHPTTLAGTVHYNGSRHYLGRAVDFDNNSNHIVTGANVHRNVIFQFLEDEGFMTQRTHGRNRGESEYFGNNAVFHLCVWGRN